MARDAKEATIPHNIPPFYEKTSKILILGSFPSVKSREARFFYNHPQNRFWKVLAGIFGEPVPLDKPEKLSFLKRRRIALWDVVAACGISGSSDSSIKNVVPNDLGPILEAASIRAIFTNGGTASRLYARYQGKTSGIEAVPLPSTSPANAAFSLEKLIECWSVIRNHLE